MKSNGHPSAEGRFNQIEFFMQDNWRLRRNFTVDMGIRFVHVGPTYVAGQKVAYFDPAKYDPAKPGEVQARAVGVLLDHLKR